MNAGGDAEIVLPRDFGGAPAVVEIFADGNHRGDAGVARAGDYCVAVVVELLVVDVAVRVDHESRAAGRATPRAPSA